MHIWWKRRKKVQNTGKFFAYEGGGYGTPLVLETDRGLATKESMGGKFNCGITPKRKKESDGNATTNRRLS